MRGDKKLLSLLLENSKGHRELEQTLQMWYTMQARSGLGDQGWDEGLVGKQTCFEAEEARQGLGGQEWAKDKEEGGAVADTGPN